jgi:CRISPR/Cas system CSM-associated protein Csm3 (group 7 of RAMP superfamily)
MSVSILWLSFTLKSDALIGRGDGVAGMVDAEIKHDRFGLPYLSGKTLKGLLVAQCAEIMFALEKIGVKDLNTWQVSAQNLFGSPGSGMKQNGKLRVEDACLPVDLRSRVEDEFRSLEIIQNVQERERRWGIRRMDYLEALTALRRQTAIDSFTGAPQRNSLRTMRVVLRTTPFVARLESRPALEDPEAQLLAACVSSLRRLGSHRNRGLGVIKADLYQDPLFDPDTNLPTSAKAVTSDLLSQFDGKVSQK